MTPLLVVTAVEAEAAAVRAGLGEAATVVAAGAGPAAAAAGAARLLALAEAGGRPYRAVLCMGIAGGFPGRVPVGGTVVATRSVAADLGAETPDGFLAIDELGFGTAVHDTDPALVATLRSALPEAVAGTILTVSTVTGTSASTERLMARFPDAVAEGMEGTGVAQAAGATAFAEVRTVSNLIGPRDRDAWRIPDALAALTRAARALATVARDGEG